MALAAGKKTVHLAYNAFPALLNGAILKNPFGKEGKDEQRTHKPSQLIYQVDDIQSDC